LYKILKVQITKEKLDKRDCIKLRSFCMVKEETTQKIFSGHSSDEEIISGTYK
jgi:hypothetical protein